MSEDIGRLFSEDIHNKKKAARGVRSRTGLRGYVGKMRFPSDIMSRKDKYAYRRSSKVKISHVYDEVSAEQFDTLGVGTQEQMIRYLVDEKGFSLGQLQDRLELDDKRLSEWKEKLGLSKKYPVKDQMEFKLEAAAASEGEEIMTTEKRDFDRITPEIYDGLSSEAKDEVILYFAKDKGMSAAAIANLVGSSKGKVYRRGKKYDLFGRGTSKVYGNGMHVGDRGKSSKSSEAKVSNKVSGSDNIKNLTSDVEEVNTPINERVDSSFRMELSGLYGEGELLDRVSRLLRMVEGSGSRFKIKVELEEVGGDLDE